MSVSVWLDEKRSDQSAQIQRKECDVAIVGCGIAGLSLAYWLKKLEPKLRILMLEKQRPLSGASGRNAGFVTCGSLVHFQKMQAQFGFDEALEIWRISEDNHRLFQSEFLRQGDRFDYALTGSCTVAPDAKAFQSYQDSVDQLNRAGLKFSVVSPEAIQSDFGIRALSGGALYHGDGFVHPVKLLRALQSELTARHGVEILTDEEVYSFEPRAKGESGWTIESNRYVVSANKVALATNAYSRALMPSLHDKVVPGRGQIIVTEPVPQFIRGPCYYTPSLTYFRQLPSGEVLLGGFRNLALAQESTLADEVSSTIQTALEQFLRSHLPAASHAKIKYRWAGAMAFTADGQPVVGEWTHDHRARGLYLQIGCSGHGMGLGFKLGQILAKNILENAPVPRAFEAFRLTAVAQGQLP